MLNRKLAEREAQVSQGNVTMTQEQFNQLLEALGSSKKMNPLEEIQYQQQVEAQKRAQLMREGVQAEEQSQQRRKASCTHSRYPMSAGARGGLPCPKGQGEWTTGGQTLNNRHIVLICTRCARTWKWEATPEQLQAANDGGLLGIAPPSEDICLQDCAYCNKPVKSKDLAEHEAQCKAALESRASA